MSAEELQIEGVSEEKTLLTAEEALAAAQEDFEEPQIETEETMAEAEETPAEPDEEPTDAKEAPAASEKKQDGEFLAAAKETVERNRAARSSRGAKRAPTTMPSRNAALNSVRGDKTVGSASAAANSIRSEARPGARIRVREERARTNAQEILPIAEQLDSARRAHTILHGTIVAAGEHGDTICAIVLFGEIQIYIPFAEFFADAPIDPDGPSATRASNSNRMRQRTFLSRYLGAEVDFMITKVTPISSTEDHGQYAFEAMASRRDALARIRERTFAPNRNVRRGDIIDARVLSVSQHAVVICAGGIDQILYRNQLTNAYNEDLQDRYSVAQELPVVVADIERDDKRHLVKVSYSARVYETNEERKKYKKLEVDMNYVGRLSHIYQNNGHGKTNYVVYLLGYGISVSAERMYVRNDNFSRTLRRGDTVLFQVKRISDTGVEGVIIRRLAPSDPSNR